MPDNSRTWGVFSVLHRGHVRIVIAVCRVQSLPRTEDDFLVCPREVSLAAMLKLYRLSNKFIVASRGRDDSVDVSRDENGEVWSILAG